MAIEKLKINYKTH